MEPVKFTHNMLRLRQLLLWCTLLLLILALAGGVMLSLRNRSLYGIVEVVTAFGGIAFLVTLMLLWMVYFAKPEVKEKRLLTVKLRKLERELLNAQSDLAESLQQEESIRQKYQDEQVALREKFEEQQKAFEDRIQRIIAAQQDELSQTLSNLQAAHIEAGLRANQLDPTDIPGIGDVLIQKLNAYGIHTAFDVNSQAIQAIPGFGESKALSLVRWRESVERALVATQPQTLPAEQQQAIEQKYANQLLEVKNERAAARENAEKTLNEIQQKSSTAQAEAIARQTSARQRLKDLEQQKYAVSQDLEPYRQITFPRSLMATMINISPGTLGQKALAFLVVFTFLILGTINLIIFIAAAIMERS